MAVTNDLDLGTDIHPVNKEPIGYRMSLHARALVYGESSLVYSGPIRDISQSAIQGNQIVIGFNHVDGGLVTNPPGSAPGPFKVAGSNGVYFDATAQIVGNTVVVSSASVPSPVSVQYVWSYARGNLYNGAGLPASPFQINLGGPTPTPGGPTPTRTNTPASPTNTPTRTNTPVPTNTPTVGPSPTPTWTNTPAPPTNTPGAGGIAFVKNIGSASCGSPSNTITVPAGGVAASHTLIARLTIRDSNPGGAVTVSDSKGNTYTIDNDFTGFSTRVVILSANIGTALVSGDTLTITYPAAGLDSTASVVSEFSGIAATNRVDATGSGSGNSSAPSASLTTLNANDLLYGVIIAINNPTYTEPSGWTTDAHLSAACGGAPGNSTNHGAYRIVSSAGSYTYNPTLNSSVFWTEAMVAYK
jgi:hypothetical protein